MSTLASLISGRQRVILLVLLGAGFMLSVDFSILNVALPEVGAGVGMGLTGLPWITSAYALPAAGFTLLFGRLADLFGRRRLFMSGMILLTLASLLGGFATTPDMLLTARVLQGFATAMTIPASLSLLTTTFTEGATLRPRPRLQRRAALGRLHHRRAGGRQPRQPAELAGRVLHQRPRRPWSSCCSHPFVISESRLPDRVKLDLPGAVTVTGGLLAVIYAVIERNLPSAVIGVLLLAAFWMIELRSPAPLVPGAHPQAAHSEVGQLRGVRGLHPWRPP
ncbi:MFS transporter [Nonomuraea dietziae]|uniref:MFS transporter n=1 Tax=Nonomuraea dietziae TaxID=65515 RepID=UPI0031DFD83A